MNGNLKLPTYSTLFTSQATELQPQDPSGLVSPYNYLRPFCYFADLLFVCLFLLLLEGA